MTYRKPRFRQADYEESDDRWSVIGKQEVIRAANWLAIVSVGETSPISLIEGQERSIFNARNATSYVWLIAEDSSIQLNRLAESAGSGVYGDLTSKE